MRTSLSIASILYFATSVLAFGDRQAILGEITSSGFVVGSPADASDGLIKETELRLKPNDPTEDDLDGKIIQMKVTVTSHQDVIIPLGSFRPGIVKIKCLKWGSNDHQSGSFTVNHTYGTDYENFAPNGPWILSAEEWSVPGHVKLLAKRGWSGGWGVTYFLQVRNPHLITPTNEIAITIETHAHVAEWYYEGGETTALEVPKVSSINQYTKEIGLNSAVKVTGSLSLNGEPVATQTSLPVILEGITGKVDIGNGSAATGAVAIGTGNPSATMDGAVALGYGYAYGQYAFAAGQAKAGGFASVAIGDTTTTAAGYYAVALGKGNASGSFSFAAGNSTALGTRATALSAGYASGDHSVALGVGSGAYSRGETVVGMFNKPLVGNPTTWVATDRIFTVGNGENYEPPYQSNAIEVLKNGETTLINKKWSETTPLDDPDANDATDADGNALVVKGHARLQGKVVIEQAQGDISMGIYE